MPTSYSKRLPSGPAPRGQKTRMTYEDEVEYRRHDSGISVGTAGSDFQGAVAIPQYEMEPSATAAAELRGLVSIVDTATDREGSRKLQILLDCVGKEERQYVYSEVLPQAVALMHHVFGNYVMQRVLHYGTPQQHQVLQQIVADHIIELSQNTFGCRVVQKALEVLNKEAAVHLTTLLQTHVLHLASDQHGNHVLQRCLEVMPESAVFIARELQGSLCSTACQKYGCRVVQRLVTAVAEDKMVITAVIEEVVQALHKLVNDQFGNYVIQAVMRCRNPMGLKPVYLLRGSYPIMCKHKHASNVVETAFSVANASLRNALLQELTPNIIELAGDQFGNFVVQRIYEQSDASQQAALSAALMTGASWLKSHMYGRSVMSMLQRSEKAAAASADPLPRQQGVPQQLPQSQYAPAPLPVTVGRQTAGPYPMSPLTPLTPSTPASSDWTHNPRYGSLPEPVQGTTAPAPGNYYDATPNALIDDEPDEISAIYQGECYGF